MNLKQNWILVALAALSIGGLCQADDPNINTKIIKIRAMLDRFNSLSAKDMADITTDLKNLNISTDKRSPKRDQITALQNRFNGLKASMSSAAAPAPSAVAAMPAMAAAPAAGPAGGKKTVSFNDTPQIIPIAGREISPAISQASGITSASADIDKRLEALKRSIDDARNSSNLYMKKQAFDASMNLYTSLEKASKDLGGMTRDEYTEYHRLGVLLDQLKGEVPTVESKYGAEQTKTDEKKSKNERAPMSGTSSSMAPTTSTATLDSSTPGSEMPMGTVPAGAAGAPMEAIGSGSNPKTGLYDTTPLQLPGTEEPIDEQFQVNYL